MAELIFVLRLASAESYNELLCVGIMVGLVFCWYIYWVYVVVLVGMCSWFCWYLVLFLFGKCYCF